MRRGIGEEKERYKERGRHKEYISGQLHVTEGGGRVFLDRTEIWLLTEGCNLQPHSQAITSHFPSPCDLNTRPVNHMYPPICTKLFYFTNSTTQL